MKTLKLLFLFIFVVHALHAATYENRAFTSPLPAASSSKEEFVTAADYVLFLNATVRDGRENLFQQKMKEDFLSACIVQKGTPENHTYYCIAGRESFPVHYTSSFDKESYSQWIQSLQNQTTFLSSQEAADVNASFNGDLFLTSNQESLTVDQPLYQQCLSLGPLIDTHSWTPEGERASGAMAIGLFAALCHVGIESCSAGEGSGKLSSLPESRPETQEELLTRVQEQYPLKQPIASSLGNSEARKTSIHLASEAGAIGDKLYKHNLLETHLAQKLWGLSDVVRRTAISAFDESDVTNIKSELHQNLEAIKNRIDTNCSNKKKFSDSVSSISDLWAAFPIIEAQSADASAQQAQEMKVQLERLEQVIASEIQRINRQLSKPNNLSNHSGRSPNRDLREQRESMQLALKHVNERLVAAIQLSEKLKTYKACEATAAKAHQELSTLLSEVRPTATNNEAKSHLLLVLNTLQAFLNRFTPNRETPDKFLNKIFDGTIDDNFASSEIRALNGKMLLHNPKTRFGESIGNPNDGLQLIRLAIQDLCGTQARKAFDYQHAADDLSLLVSELKGLFKTNKNDEGSRTFTPKYFIDLQKLPTSLRDLQAELISSLESEDSSKIIELKREKENFNPFSQPLHDDYIEASIILDGQPSFDDDHSYSTKDYDTVSVTSENDDVASSSTTEYNFASSDAHKAPSQHKSINDAKTILSHFFSEQEERAAALSRFDKTFSQKNCPEQCVTVQRLYDFLAQEIEMENKKMEEQNRFCTRIYRVLTEDPLFLPKSIVGGMGSVFGGKIALLLLSLEAVHLFSSNASDTQSSISDSQ